MVNTGFQSSLKGDERSNVSTFFSDENEPENIQTNVSFEIDVRMVDLLGAFHFRGRMRIIGLNVKREDESTSTVITLKETNRRDGRILASI